jgi:hypothetical protein
MLLRSESETGTRRRPAASIRSFLLWAFALGGIGLVWSGCTPAGISSGTADALSKEVETRGLIVGLEGLQPFSGFRAEQLVGAVGEELGLAHAATSGNYMAHMPIIEQANKRGQPIYLVGYSLGGDQARLLAEECGKRGIPIRILFLLDPHYMAAETPGKIPSNVRRAVFYTSSTYADTVGVVPSTGNLADPAQTALLVEDLPGTGHMGLPEHATRLIQSEIARDLR